MSATTRQKLRIAVLSGGPSREHGVSLKSGAAVAQALASRGHRVLSVTIGTDGRWALPGSAALPAPTTPAEDGVRALARPPAVALAELSAGVGEAQPVDVVFVALHGPYGEDGTVQGFLETAGVPYTGSGVAASAFAMDKERTKEVLSHHGIVTAPWLGVTRTRWESERDRVLERIETHLGRIVVVKPPREGSSFGVSRAEGREEIATLLDELLEAGEGRALVERWIAGLEVTAPVLGNCGGALRTLPLVEIRPLGGRIFDFAAKYEGDSEEICPARLAEDVAQRVREAAITAHRVLGCDGVSRSDFIADAEGQPWFLETNTVPGMTAESLVPLSARSAGIDFARLCEMLVELAIERAQRRAP